MIELTREQAENLISNCEVLNSHVERQASELKIVMKLSDQRSFLVRYDTKNHHKMYFIDQPITPEKTNGH